MKTELLAPAGDIEAGYAAFYYGADAVYLGLNRFSARAQAVNFSPEQLDELTAYAHSVGKKVYVALNTLVQEHEMSGVLEMLSVCRACAVDGIIVQDLGIVSIIKEKFPTLPLHASTQLAVHNLEGVRALKKMGFTRVVLARELTYDEIHHIQEATDMEIEVFVHGALCYSYSGLCSFSSLETGRSANRGKCVYACRDVFERNGQKNRLFSMKDLALQADVLKLKNMSLKIEGRKKNALYVAAVTQYYRTILDTGRSDVSLSDNIKQIFARPWTKLHFAGKNKDVTDVDFAGHRGLKIGTVDKIMNHVITIKPSHAVARYDGIQIDIAGQEKPFGFSAEQLKVNGKNVFEVPAGQTVDIALPPHHPFISKGLPVYLASAGAVKGSYPYTKPKPGAFKHRHPIDVAVFIEAHQITAVSEGVSATMAGEFSVARQAEAVSKAVQQAFEKTGDTVFELRQLTLQNPAGLFAPASVLNEVRRQLYDRIIIEPQTVTLPQTPLLNHAPVQKARWIVKTDQPQAVRLIPADEVDEYIIELTREVMPADIQSLNPDKVRLALPLISRKTDMLKRKIKEFWAAGYRRFEISNISGLDLVPAGADFTCDSTIYCLNAFSMNQTLSLKASRVTFATEDTGDNIQKLARLSNQTCLIVYQHIPLFISDNCVRENSCEACTHKPQYDVIHNRSGAFELVSKSCLSVVTDQRAFCLSKEYQQVPVGAYRVDLTIVPFGPQQALGIWQQVRAGRMIPDTFSGNFNKNFA